MKGNQLYLLFFGFLMAFVSGNAQGSSFKDSVDYTIRKGRYYSSITFSLSQRNAENEDQLFRTVVDQNRYNYRIIGNGGFAIKDNFTLGLSAGYGRRKEEVTFLDENNQEVTSNSLEQGLSIAPNFRKYIPIGKGQLQILVQTELGFTFGESLEKVFYTDEVDRVDGDFIEIDLGLSPGLLLFFNRNWAFEASVDVAGLSYRFEEETLNNDEANKTRIEETNIDLRLNLFELNLGVAFYF
jgi:hypothetical protein